LHVAYFSVQFRRFLVLGLPKLLRAFAPDLGIQSYIGLMVLSCAPVLYNYINPYTDPNDAVLMTLTQLAQTVVVLCGMVKQQAKGDEANLIVTIIIMCTLVPMFLILLTFLYDPR
jgi:hypothetical protein